MNAILYVKPTNLSLWVIHLSERSLSGIFPVVTADVDMGSAVVSIFETFEKAIGPGLL